MKNTIRIFFICCLLFGIGNIFPACDDTLKVENNPNITRAFLVGDALRGWTDYDQSPLGEPMLRTGDTVFEFRGYLTPGFLKISCDEIPDWDGRWYVPKIDTVLNTETVQNMVFSASGDGGETGAKWEITKAAEYTITLNKAAGTIRCVEVGDYKPQGTNDLFTNMWLIICTTPPRPVKMEPQPDGTWKLENQVLSSTIQTSSRYVKFNGESLAVESWDTFSIRWFCPLSDQMPVFMSANPVQEEESKYMRYGSDNEFSWMVAANGYYTIVLDPRKGEVTFSTGTVP